jgi:hypothetical protein
MKKLRGSNLIPLQFGNEIHANFHVQQQSAQKGQDGLIKVAYVNMKL